MPSPTPKGHAARWIYCGDMSGNCPSAADRPPTKGLPVMVVDEEIYRRLPTLLIATVDKFAQMPWNGAVQMLFGQVNGYCSRHGFRSPEIRRQRLPPENQDGPAIGNDPSHIGPLRPPDLIIQDELHLISGPLGTLVGLYETAIDKLCTWEVNGKKVRPKVVASTATIRNADVQVHKLFLRKVNIFPATRPGCAGQLLLPPAGAEREVSWPVVHRHLCPWSACEGGTDPGLRGLPVLPPKRSTRSTALDADPWMTLVGYFNSMRELGGMRRLVDDDVPTRCQEDGSPGLGEAAA